MLLGTEQEQQRFNLFSNGKNNKEFAAGRKI